MRASPRGASGDNAAGDHDGTRSARQPHRNVARQPEREQLSPIGAHGCHRRVVLALDDALTDEGLAHHR